MKRALLAVGLVGLLAACGGGSSTITAPKVEKRAGLVDYRHAVGGKPVDVAVGKPHGKITFQKALPEK